MEPKRFLFCSLEAALVGDLAWHVRREGHGVKYYIEAERDREIADGFVPKTDDWRAELDWADVIDRTGDSLETAVVDPSRYGFVPETS